MKKFLLSPVLLIAALISFNAQAQDPTCDTIVWTDTAIERIAAVGDYCLEMDQKDGAWYAKFRARVERQNPVSTTVKYQRPDGSWSGNVRAHPDISERAELNGRDVLVSELGQGTEVSVYLKEGDNFSLPAPAATAAAAPAATSAPDPEPAAEPEPEPEPAPRMLPKTAGQANWLALLGTLLIMLSAGVYVRRQF
ncbi:MAG TPA: LPXTG cell wall anchor domain-containing protein [Xanthomonadales bacterium]|nr:LPXTG cell wall anchor domain-containing protein [Xanthomonadales bacterium]